MTSKTASSPTSVNDLWSNSYSFTTCLARGYSGDIFRGEETVTDDTGRESSTVVVFKIFHNRKHYEAEKSALERVHAHPHIVTLRNEPEVSTWKHTPPDLRTDANILILDHCAGGDLFEYVRTRRFVSLIQLRSISVKMLSALIHCQTQGIWHRDLKLENIFLTTPNDPTSIVLGDFGFATNTPRGVVSCGTLGYMSPEALAVDENGYDHELADVWSLGVLLFSLFFQIRPYSEPIERGERWCQEKDDTGKWATNAYLEALYKQQYTRFWTSTSHSGKNVHFDRLWGNDKTYPYTKDLRNFFEVMFAPIEKRATFAELTTHPFLTGKKLSIKRKAFTRTRSTSEGWNDLPR